jgi:hypothetical protein
MIPTSRPGFNCPYVQISFPVRIGGISKNLLPPLSSINLSIHLSLSEISDEREEEDEEEEEDGDEGTFAFAKKSDNKAFKCSQYVTTVQLVQLSPPSTWKDTFKKEEERGEESRGIREASARALASRRHNRHKGPAFLTFHPDRKKMWKKQRKEDKHYQ